MIKYLLASQQVELNKIDEQRKAIIAKYAKEITALELWCEEHGGHTSNDGFMYDSCVRCGKMGT